jgi:DNA-directed RNA polymerase subunit RPC12/RpoP
MKIIKNDVSLLLIINQGGLMSPNEPSGIYACTKCGNEETHVEGKNFAPCSKCGTNSWRLVRRTR